MATVPSSNLVGITGIARRLVLDGNLDEATAREALDTASREKRQVAGYLLEKKLVSSAALAAANSIEFGMQAIPGWLGVGNTEPSTTKSQPSVAACCRSVASWQDAESN